MQVRGCYFKIFRGLTISPDTVLYRAPYCPSALTARCVYLCLQSVLPGDVTRYAYATYSIEKLGMFLEDLNYGRRCWDLSREDRNYFPSH